MQWSCSSPKSKRDTKQHERGRVHNNKVQGVKTQIQKHKRNNSQPYYSSVWDICAEIYNNGGALYNKSSPFCPPAHLSIRFRWNFRHGPDFIWRFVSRRVLTFIFPSYGYSVFRLQCSISLGNYYSGRLIKNSVYWNFLLLFSSAGCFMENKI